MKRPLARSRPAWTTGAASVVLLSFTACATTATVQRSNGPAYEATLTSSDSGAVYVRAENGLTYRVPRAEVVDIDHPGNVLVAVGLSLIAVGALIGYTVRHDTEVGQPQTSVGEATFIGLLYAVPGVALTAYGGATYWNSTKNARAFGDPTPIVGPPPQMYPPPGYAWPPPGYAWPPPPAGAAPAPAPPAGTTPAPAPPDGTTPAPAPPAP